MNKNITTAIIALIGLIILVGGSFLYLRGFYENALETANSDSSETIEFEIKTIWEEI